MEKPIFQTVPCAYVSGNANAKNIFQQSNWWYQLYFPASVDFETTHDIGYALTQVQVDCTNKSHQVIELAIDYISKADAKSAPARNKQSESAKWLDKYGDALWKEGKTLTVKYGTEGDERETGTADLDREIKDFRYLRLRVIKGTKSGAVGLNRFRIGGTSYNFSPVLITGKKEDEHRKFLCGDERTYQFRGQPGTLEVYAETAFSLHGKLEDNAVKYITGAASDRGNRYGRLFLHPHNSFYAYDSVLLGRAVPWLCKAEGKSSETLNLNSAGLSDAERSVVESNVKKQTGNPISWNHTTSSSTLDALVECCENGKGYPILFASSDLHIDPNDPPTEQIKKVQNYIDVQGGGLMIAATPWNWHRNIAKEFVVNWILSPYGLAFTDDYTLNHPCTLFTPENSDLEGVMDRSISKALDCLAQAVIKTGGYPAAGCAVFHSDMNRLPPKVMSMVFGSLPLGSKAKRTPQYANDPAEIAAVALAKDMSDIVKALGSGNLTLPIKMETDDIMYGADAARSVLITAWQYQMTECYVRDPVVAPDTESFPGSVASSAKPVKNKKIELDPKVPDWQTTGLYVVPGQQVWLEIDPKTTWSGNFSLSVIINTHSDKISGNTLQRFPDVQTNITWKADTTKTSDEEQLKYTVEATRTGSRRICVSSPFGGMLMFKLNDVPTFDGKLIIIVDKGAVPALWYNADCETSYKKQYSDLIKEHTMRRTGYDLIKGTWADKAKANGAPWGEIEGELIIFTLPIHALRALKDPARFCRFWDGVVAADLKASNQTLTRKERVVADVQISHGYMHAGYPVMTQLDTTTGEVPEVVDLDNLEANGDWGYFHELGHNRQKDEWTPSNAVEVTVNIFSMIAMWQVVGLSPFEVSWFQGAMKQSITKLSDDKQFVDWNDEGIWGNLKLALSPFGVFMQRWGIEGIHRFFVRYQQHDVKPSTNAEIMTEWVIQSSLAVGYDTRAFWNAWGWNYDKEKAEKKLKDLPKDEYDRFRILIDLKDFFEAGGIPLVKPCNTSGSSSTAPSTKASPRRGSVASKPKKGNWFTNLFRSS